MNSKIYTLIFLSFLVLKLDAQIGRLPLSPVQTIEQNIGITDITLKFSRPSMRGRTIFGGLVPYGEIWRTGANRNTTIQFSQDVIIDGKRIEKGKYAIFSSPAKEQWEIIFYKETDNWDVPEDFDTDKIAAKIVVKSHSLQEALEVFTISIGDFTNYTFDLNIAWSKTFVSIPIQLTTKELMDEKIEKVFGGPDYHDYYAAAVYQMESGKEFQKGLDWINTAIKVTDKVTWWDLRVKAILLMELGEKEEAIKFAKQGLKMLPIDDYNRDYGVNQFNQVLKRLE